MLRHRSHPDDQRRQDHHDDELPPPPPADGTPMADRDRDLVVDDRGEVVDRTDLDRRDDRDGIRDRDEDRDHAMVAGRGDRDVVDDDREVAVVRTRAFSVGQLISLVLGGLLAALGVVALVRTGIDTPLNQPVEDVLGWDHTPLLGILEIAAGALLVLFSLRPGGRWLVALVGLALIAGGVIMASEMDWSVDELAAEQGFGWLIAAAGALAVIAALLTPRRRQVVRGVLADDR